MLRLAVPAELAEGEARVALVPRSLAQVAALGTEISIEAGAGAAAGFADAAYRDAGATVEADRARLLEAAELVLVVRRPAAADLGRLRPGSALVGLLDPGADREWTSVLLERRVTAFALEAMPRISRAQDMDVLSSMATLAGYRAALLAAARLPRIFPLLMTAAGTITPARVLVLGAGVAGLQAIATCRRLGAVVEAYDVRPAVREQVESLGARFIEVGIESAQQQDAGGYATELSRDAVAREHEVLGAHVRDSDVVITTAFVPNRPAPVLITRDMVAGMRPGSVVLDLAAPAGGNCELTQADQEVDANGVTILGPSNLPASLPGQASQLYSHNLSRFLQQIVREGGLRLDFDDPVVAQTCITHEGRPAPGELQSSLAGTGA